jgi:hypothetical protein
MRRRAKAGPAEPQERGLDEAPIKANQTESNRIKPNQTKSNQINLRGWGVEIMITIKSSHQKVGAISAQSNRSNPVKPEKEL